MSVVISVVIAYLLDMLIGTPPFVRGIKSGLSTIINNVYSRIDKRLACVLTLVLLIGVGTGVYFAVDILKDYNMILAIIAEGIICFFCISCREVKDNGERVCRPLRKGYVKSAARLYQSFFDAEEKDPEKIAEKTLMITTNSSLDKVMAPIFFILLFGCTGGVTYKLISLIAESAHQKFAIALKNICDIVPVRIQVFFMQRSAGLLKLDKTMGKRIYKRDRYKLDSLNSGLIPAYCAGALNAELYLGREEPVIGKTSRSKRINADDIIKSCELINLSALLAFVVLVALRLAVVIFVV